MTDDVREAVGRLEAWVRDFVVTKLPVFVADLNTVLEATEATSLHAKGLLEEVVGKALRDFWNTPPPGRGPCATFGWSWPSGSDEPTVR